MQAVTRGIDFGWGRPHPLDIKRAGFGVVLRYLSHDLTGKTLSHAEALGYTAAGLDVVSIFEDAAARALQGESAGVLDARFAYVLHRQCGGPDSAPIYFADDTDTNAELGAVLPYFRGAASILGQHRVRGYGSAGLCDFLAAHGYGPNMQTRAWSGSEISAHAVIYQPATTEVIDGVTVDTDRILGANYGGWRHVNLSGVTHAEWLKVLTWIHDHHIRELWGPDWEKVTSNPSIARHWLDTGVIK